MAGTDQLTPLGHALAGALGGVVSNALVYPLDTVKTRIQAAQDEESTVDGGGLEGKKLMPKKSRQGILQLLLKIWKREGVSGFFKGFTANMINTFSMRECGSSSDYPLPPIKISPTRFFGNPKQSPSY